MALKSSYSSAMGHRLSPDQLELFAHDLAATHLIEYSRTGDHLIKRLSENEKILTEAYNLLAETAISQQSIVPAAEWLLDNFFLIESNVRLAREHFPPIYNRQLPILSSNPTKKVPRIYEIVHQLIIHLDNILDEESLFRFVQGYQRHHELRLGELWAIPIMMRLVLIEMIRQVAVRTVSTVLERNNAASWANRIIAADSSSTTENIIFVLADMVRQNPDMPASFIAELHRRLQRSQKISSFPHHWLETHLASHRLSTEQIIAQENQQQAADQVTISNGFGSLRLISSIDWRRFVESVSVIDKILRQDPANKYVHMDFATRDMYRHCVERMAKQCQMPESQVATTALQMATCIDDKSVAVGPRFHVGFYLTGKGISELEKKICPEFKFRKLMQHIAKGYPHLSYFGILSTSLIAIVLILIGSKLRDLSLMTSTIMTFFTVIAASQAAMSFTNWIITKFASPRRLPKMDYSDGIPGSSMTLVVIPTLLSSEGAVRELLHSLEVHFLANQDPHIRFAILSDFLDSHEEITSHDIELASMAQSGIRALNQKYNRGPVDSFFLFHRPRRWNPSEDRWMGYERKRGKLADLNAYLRQKDYGQFSIVEGKNPHLSQTKYVITLDTDTELPREAAHKLIGTFDHPLNQPQVDPNTRKVITGYSILQPRVAISLESAARSRFARLFCDEPGIDPYTREVSDVYQDLFAEGSFIGKGIYEIDAFEATLGERFPENLILSHDLIESCFARSALVSDVILYEDFPAGYHTETKRRHRWTRGDWQILFWILPFVPNFYGKKVRNSLDLFSRWKIFDNLRRSLVPPVIFVLFFLSILIPQKHAAIWTSLILGLVVTPQIISMIEATANLSRHKNFRTYLLNLRHTMTIQFSRGILGICLLAHEATHNTHAIGTTLIRLFIRRRNLLEWNSAKNTEMTSSLSLKSMLRSMWFSVLSGTTLILIHPNNPLLYFVGLAWISSPALAWWISLPLKQSTPTLGENEITELAMLARKTWRYFDDFVTIEDHHLPIDNMQEFPSFKKAHRTSPTNIGLYVLSSLAAFDFGYIDLPQLLTRIEATLKTLNTLPRFRGHFYNWYDTKTLKTLTPKYISSVDSGNFISACMTLRSGLLQMHANKQLSMLHLRGIFDAVLCFREILEVEKFDLDDAGIIERILQLCLAPDEDPQTVTSSLTTLEEHIEHLRRDTLTAPKEALYWLDKIELAVKERRQNLDFLFPWMSLNEPHCHSLDGSVLYQDIVSLLYQNSTLKQGSDPKNAHEALLNCQTSAQKLNEPSLERWLQEVVSLLQEKATYLQALLERCQDLAEQCMNLADADFTFLYNPKNKLLHIGYNVDHNQPDNSYYDLLASESRLTSFFAIAMNKLPEEHWFSLGRQVTNVGGHPVLLSWSGSAFEYLMPLLILPSYEETLLDRTCKAMVLRQIEYGKEQNSPWGISESGYNIRDTEANYQYRAFGTPGLGFKRGLIDDLVVAPYASIMSLMVSPLESYRNLSHLKELGATGAYGYYEALDFTQGRVPTGQRYAIVKSYMAHHQGMSFLSLAYVLLNQPMQRRLHFDPVFQSSYLLLQEQIPKASPFYPHSIETSLLKHKETEAPTPLRVVTSPYTEHPECHFLSNGAYTVMISNYGMGFSRVGDIALTRWREDAIANYCGTFFFLHDLGSNEQWTTTHLPTLRVADKYEAIFSEAKAEFKRRDSDIETVEQIIVSPEHAIEIRRITIRNHNTLKRRVMVTSYKEWALGPQLAEESHPAFNRLKLDTELLQERYAVIARRRPGANDERQHHAFHMVNFYDGVSGNVILCDDRKEWFGRGHDLTASSGLFQENWASVSDKGEGLDAAAIVRGTVIIESQSEVTIDVVSGYANSDNELKALMEEYSSKRLCSRAIDLAWMHAQISLRQLDVPEKKAQVFNELAGSILFSDQRYRVDAALSRQNQKAQSGFWGYSISGDLPIVLLKVNKKDGLNLVRETIKAFNFWNAKGLHVDLVIWNEDESGYRQIIHEQLQDLITTNAHPRKDEFRGGIFLIRTGNMPEADRILMLASARIVIEGDEESLGNYLRPNRLATKPNRPLDLSLLESDSSAADLKLMFFNGIGGFTSDGREYVMQVGRDKVPPAPWVNVIANQNFGTIISESGGSYTWAENSHEFRLSPWNNDPVIDLQGEFFYIRDEETMNFWSPTLNPAPGPGVYTVTHGFGYSKFQYALDKVESLMTVFVPPEGSVKYVTIKVTNKGPTIRHLSVTGYVEWILGESHRKSKIHVVTDHDPDSDVIYAVNPYNEEFRKRICFFDVQYPIKFFTCSRRAFLGVHGNPSNPRALHQKNLNNSVMTESEPCTALQVPIELAPGMSKELVFLIGSAHDLPSMRATLHHYRGKHAVHHQLKSISRKWADEHNFVRIKTPDTALDVLFNGWLPYQCFSSRLWGKTGFYQSGGAYGFRDQLQDCHAFAPFNPDLLREQIILCAAHQFREGDVQHWWHPPHGRGVRTKFSDDYLWLPWAVCHFLKVTDQWDLLETSVSFLEGRDVGADEEAYFDLPKVSEESGSIYEHCSRAIKRALKFGQHGLPLIGCGDWNDAFNHVGLKGHGESVWVGFFLYQILCDFKAVARHQNDIEFVALCEESARQLQDSLEANAWDGLWYRRAYYDDGTPMGSASSRECQIDALSQSWAVISQAGSPARCREAMDQVYARLMDRENGILKIFTPPFDQSPENPGYVKAYKPGTRENGGQYTHAAAWTAMAFALQGEGEKVHEIISMLNPINHGHSSKSVQQYQIEPYVVAADVYSHPDFAGRGGWSWYTGSAAWVFRIVIEYLLGLQIRKGHLTLTPCIPLIWSGYEIEFRYGEAHYTVKVQRHGLMNKVTRLTLDDQDVHGESVPLSSESDHHVIVVYLG